MPFAWLRPIALALLAAAAGASSAQADGARRDGPVVVELFTSQGCSSCPPADALLAEELADRPDVIALSLHVDYWDYLGWRDVHARHAFTERQVAYRDMAGARSIYTPQMVIDGRARVVGSRRAEVMEALHAAAAAPPACKVALGRDGKGLWAEIEPMRNFPGEAVVWLVGYETAPRPVKIKRGENQGLTIENRNVVTSWLKLGMIGAGAKTVLRAPTPEGADAVAVIVQHGRVGPVLGAAKLRF